MAKDFTAELSRIEIRKDAENPWGKVLIDGHTIQGVGRVGLVYEGGETPVVTLDIHPGELVIDVNAISEVVLGTAALSKDQLRTVLARLVEALGRLEVSDAK